jgi:hypothetical protein
VLSIGLFALLRFVGGPEHLLGPGLHAAENGSTCSAPAGRAKPALGDKKQALDDATAGSTELSTLFGDEAWLEPLRAHTAEFNRLPRKEQAEQIFSGVLRYGPYAMFALLLKMLYVGRAQRYPLRPRGYAAHLVFGAHNHAFVFLAGALLALLPRGAVRTALILWVMVYLLLSMRAVCGGRWSCVIARAAVIFVYLVIFSLVVAGLVVAAILLH